MDDPIDTATVGGLKKLLAGLPDDTKLYIADADTDWRIVRMWGTVESDKLLLSTNYSEIEVTAVGNALDQFKAGV